MSVSHRGRRTAQLGDEDMESKRYQTATRSCLSRRVGARYLAVLGMLALAWAFLQPVPARAEHLLQYSDVACGSGLSLSKASGVPAGSVHDYVFRGVCSLRSIFSTGPWVEAHPPLVATARWERATGTYHESIHLLAPLTINQAECHDCNPNFSSPVDVTTQPEDATFKCDVDPVIHGSAHCTLVDHYNATGWGGKYHGFSQSAVHDRPLLTGRATLNQAAAMSKHAAAHALVNCRGLHLSDATGVPGGKMRSYKFSGTCQLYHTPDGSGGLQVTHVLANGKWDALAQQAKEGVTVLTAPNQGGGGWSTTYTCTADPWLNRHAQCSKTSQLGKMPPVYDPITDILARHPITMGMVNLGRATELSKAHGGASGHKSVQHQMFGFSGHGSRTATRSAHRPSLPKPKLVIQYAHAAITHDCSPEHLLSVDVTVRNDGGPLKALTPLAYVHAAESGGARLTSPHVALLAIGPGQTWHAVLAMGTARSYLAKVPGAHTLFVAIGPAHVDKSRLAFVPPRPVRVTVRVPAGYCQPKMHISSPSGARMNTGTKRTPATRQMRLPAVQ